MKVLCTNGPCELKVFNLPDHYTHFTVRETRGAVVVRCVYTIDEEALPDGTRTARTDYNSPMEVEKR